MDIPNIFLLRHGQTQWNALGRFQGQLNSPLSAQGRAQAENMGEILAREINDPAAYSMYVSPLGRTLETAEHIHAHFPFLPAHEPRLMEINFGDWSGMSKYEIDMEYGDLLAGCDARSWEFSAPNGETLAQMQNRGRDWLESLAGPTIALGHGLMGRIIRGLVLDLEEAQMLRLQDRQDGIILLENGTERFLTL